MASRVLYPPILNDYEPAFVGEECRIYLHKSALSDQSVNIDHIQISIKSQRTGQNMVSLVDSDERYRRTGIIINAKIQVDENGKDYVVITSNDIKNGWSNYVGELFNIQVRSSEVSFPVTIVENGTEVQKGAEENQAEWLTENANYFSEWSNICVIKKTGDEIVLEPLNDGGPIMDSNTILATYLNQYNIKYIYDENGNVIGKESYDIDKTEPLYSYQILIYETEDAGQTATNLLEDSGIIYSNQYINNNMIRYNSKLSFVNGEVYSINIKYETLNKYSSEQTFSYLYTYSFLESELDVSLNSIETNKAIESTIGLEEDNGYIYLKFNASANSEVDNIHIRRANHFSQWNKWEDVCIFPFKDNNEYIFKDKTIQSGYIYKYQILAEKDNILKVTKKDGPYITVPIVREFNYSFLLGQNGQQLALQFNNKVNNYQLNISDSKMATLGAQYPIITRNGNTKYKSFSINGLISYNMDEENLFLSFKDYYGEEVYNILLSDKKHIYTLERDFRNEVIKFLTDGKPKLYKSPTEGNILVRLTDVSLTPEESISRIVYSFSATANEIAEATADNLKKYNILTLE